MTADLEGIQVVDCAGGVEFAVKVVPGASRTRVAGVWRTALKLSVSAPPEAGRANAAVVKLLAKLLGIGTSQVTIVAGQTKTLKRVAIIGLTAPQLRTRLRQAHQQPPPSA